MNLRQIDILPSADRSVTINDQFENSFERFKLILDVRSALEYQTDHIPNAINIPILNDEERATVGKLYESCTFY